MREVRWRILDGDDRGHSLLEEFGKEGWNSVVGRGMSRCVLCFSGMCTKSVLSE
jgi:hypothetical protein